MAQRCPDEDTAAECYRAYYKVLEQAGLRHYEISNAAQPGYESRHNTVYWQLGEYLGIGPGAASYHEGRRFRFREDMTQFLAAEDVWRLPLDDGPGGDWEEALMLSLRLAEASFDFHTSFCAIIYITAYPLEIIEFNSRSSRSFTIGGSSSPYMLCALL